MSAQTVLELDRLPETSEGDSASQVAVRANATWAGAEPLERIAVLVEMCGEISVADMTVLECVAAVERLSLVQTRLAGLKSAALARIGQLQKADNEPVPLGSVKIPGTHRTVFELVEKGGGQSRETSRKEIQRAEAVAGPYPLFGKAIHAGQISAEYLDVLTRNIREDALKEKASRCEAELLERALREPLTMFQKSVRAWIIRNAPLKAEQEARRESRKERLSIYKEDDGVAVHGWFTSLNGLILDRALRAMIGVPSADDTRGQDQRRAQALVDLLESSSAAVRNTGDAGGDIERGSTVGSGEVEGAGRVRGVGAGHLAGVGEKQSLRPLRFQISVQVPLGTLVQTERAIEQGCRNLEELERRSLVREGSGGSSGRDAGYVGNDGYSPHVGCYQSGAGLGRQGSCLAGRSEVAEQLGGVLSTIRAGTDQSMIEGFEPARLEDGTPLIPSKLSQLLCDSSLVRVVLSARGEPLDASHAQRTFSITQTRAVHVRDRSCRFPGCDRGLEMCEIHHAQEWEQKGRTVVDNAVLLCFHHHEVIHRDEITIAHHAGGFAFYRASGALIGVRRHESREKSRHVVNE